MKRYKKYIYMGVGAIVLIVLAVVLIGLSGINTIRLDGLSVTSSVNMTGTDTARSLIAAGEEIDVTRKTDLAVAENDSYTMYLNPATMNVILEEKTSGRRFSAVYPQGNADDASLLRVKYLGDDNQFVIWDSYTYVQESQGAVMTGIDGGVAIDMHFNEGASARYYEYMPHKMPIERFEEFFLEGADAAAEDGRLEPARAKKLKSTLKLVYKKSKQEECYSCNYVGAPPTSAVLQLIELAQALGYTTDMLIEDSAAYGYTVTFTDPPVFDIRLELTLAGDGLRAVIPADSLASLNDAYIIQNIEVLPNFGLVPAAGVEEGYLFVPDGSGALMPMNTYDAMIPDYVRDIYDNDYYQDYYYMPEFNTELLMPVFGMYVERGEGGRRGFMGVIESGADIAYIGTMLAAADESSVGRPNNKIFASYDAVQYKWVYVFGENSTNKARFLVKEPQTEEDFCVRYYLYGDDVSYFKMAEDYRGYLAASSGGRLTDSDEHCLSGRAAYLEVLGTLSLNKRILGVPYNDEYAMTTYSELEQIVRDMTGTPGTSLSVTYKGVFDKGMNNSLMRKGRLVKENGSAKELEALLDTVRNTGTSLYLGTDFMRIYQSGNGYIGKLHGLHSYSKDLLDLYGFTLNTGFAYRYSNTYELLNPKYLVDTVRDFTSNVRDEGYNYYLEHMTHDYLAGYGNEYISPAESDALVDAAIESLPADARMALDDPRADKLIYGDLAVDVSRRSCEYNSFYCTIPFRQLVLNGLMEYTTGSVNNNSTTPHMFLMEAVELGSIPKFIVSAKGADVLNDSYYTGYYSIRYDVVKRDIDTVLKGLDEAYSLIGTARITDHTMLAKDVFMTKYANGTRVISNYSGITYMYGDTPVAEHDYIIIAEGR